MAAVAEIGLEYRVSLRGVPLYEEAQKGAGATCDATVVAGTDGVTASLCVSSLAGVHPYVVSQESLGSGHQLHWRHGGLEYY